MTQSIAQKSIIALIGIGLLNFSSCHQDDKHAFIDDCCCGETTYTGDADLVATMSDRGGDGNIFFIPDAFTPNGDGINDEFTFNLYSMDHDNNCYIKAISIFNSKMRKVAEPEPDVPWDGGRLKAGSYRYEAIMKFSDEREVVASGSFCIIKCFDAESKTDKILFPDQFESIHPRFGYYRPSQEPFPLCD